jgi:putative membrane protein
MNARRVCVAVVGAAVVLLPPVLLAQMDPVSTNATPSSANQPTSMRDSLGAPGQNGQEILDKQFVRKAAEDGMVDVKLGTLAADKGSPAVKDLATKLVDDHTEINKDLATVADTLGVMLPKKISKDGQAEYDKLKGLNGKDFDTEYLTFIVKAHRQELHNFYMESSIAVNPDLQAEVVKVLTTMRDHLHLISTTATDEGITLPPRPSRPPSTSTAKN